MTDTYALSRFLLARIEEEEALAREHFDVEGGPRGRWELTLAWDQDITEPIDLLIHPTRVVAECKAKREIVDLYDPHDYADDGGIGSSWVMKQALEALAAVYSDHPDYRASWRP